VVEAFDLATRSWQSSSEVKASLTPGETEYRKVCRRIIFVFNCGGLRGLERPRERFLARCLLGVRIDSSDEPSHEKPTFIISSRPRKKSEV
jgi:hypothetical protein